MKPESPFSKASEIYLPAVSVSRIRSTANDGGVRDATLLNSLLEHRCRLLRKSLNLGSTWAMKCQQTRGLTQSRVMEVTAPAERPSR
jgi:hypothetical protein